MKQGHEDTMMGSHPGGPVTASSVRCSIFEYLMVRFIFPLGSVSPGGFTGLVFDLFCFTVDWLYDIPCVTTAGKRLRLVPSKKQQEEQEDEYDSRLQFSPGRRTKLGGYESHGYTRWDGVGNFGERGSGYKDYRS
ncbi:BnaUnng00980D [Brassica napus]|uniref:BnaUnng00980D protein n=1 Tax=Brassica napus TaxID=3708 RepID=A0A078JEN6_BRANA|nr:BnaUnng00980D [Brassica napus]